MHDPSAYSSLSPLSLDALWNELSEAQRESLVRYTDLVHHYNAVANLTGLQSRPEILDSLVKESLAMLPFLRGLQPETVADIGSGAGVPGIPLAAACPDVRFTLYERSEKKASFLNIAANAMELDNIVVVADDPFAAPPDVLFSAVVTRAAIPLDELVPSARRMLDATGSLLGFASATMLEELREWSNQHGCTLKLAKYSRSTGDDSFCYALMYGGAR